MKKIVASVGLVALGASALQTASAQALVGPDPSKPWSVSATIRGFYDSNPGTVADDSSIDDKDSFGFEVTPSVALNWALQQTTINLGFLYSLKYYDEKPHGSADHADQSFTFSAGVLHEFSDSLHLRVNDSFVVGQEPDLLRSGETYSTFQRLSGDNIRNHGTLALDAQLTPVIGLGVGYDNAFYDYDDEGGNSVNPSISGLLDRLEHRIHAEGLYSLSDATKLLAGYRYMQINYTGDEAIGGSYFSDSRDSREHTIYVGAQHTFTPALSGSARAGVSFTDYFNDDDADQTTTPYFDATLKYTYAPESYVQGGFSYDRNATDVVGLHSNGEVTLDAQSGVFFLSLVQRLDPRLFFNLIGQFQNSSFNGGYYDNDAEQYYMVGLNLEYKLNQYFSAHVGYNYDRLESDLNRTFDRNRVYIGVTASY